MIETGLHNRRYSIRTKPTIGLWGLYTLTGGDALEVNRLRINDGYHGNTAREGDEYPFLICRVWSDMPEHDAPVNGQVFIDGNFTYWATSRHQGRSGESGHWYVPVAL